MRPSIAQGAQFFAYFSLIIEFKWIVMTLKNVPHTTSLEKFTFTIFFNISQLSNKPSNFVRTNKHNAVG